MYAYCAGSPGTFGLTAVTGPLTEFDKAAAGVEAQIAKAGPLEAKYLRETFLPGTTPPAPSTWGPVLAIGVGLVALFWYSRPQRPRRER